MSWVPQQEVRPEPLGWEHGVEDARRPGKSWHQGVLTGKNSQECLHPNLRPSTTHLPEAFSAGPLFQVTSKTEMQMQQMQDRNANADKLPTDTPKHTTSNDPAHKRDKSHLHPPGHREKSLLTQSLPKTLD